MLKAMPLILLALSAAAQPNVPIQNDQVRVILANSQPGNKQTPLHEHKMNRVMIYLDAGSQLTRFEDGRVDKLKWKAGEALWSPAMGKHTAQNSGDKPFRIVEVELKKGAAKEKAAFPALDPVKVDPKRYKVEMETDQVRVLRARYGAKDKGVMHEHGLNRVVVFLTPEEMKITTPDGKTTVAKAKAGDVIWGGPAKHIEENLMDGPFEVLVVEVK